MEVIETGMVPIYQDEQRRVVNARELHGFLGVGKDFSTWIKGRLDKYGFVEGEDYALVFPQTGENSQLTKGGRPSTDYLLTIDTAKEIAMSAASMEAPFSIFLVYRPLFERMQGHRRRRATCLASAELSNGKQGRTNPQKMDACTLTCADTYDILGT